MPLANYYQPDERIADLAAQADADSDPVSLDWPLPGDAPTTPDTRLPDEQVEGALVFIKGDAVVREFVAWATERGLLTPGKPWSGPRPGAN